MANRKPYRKRRKMNLRKVKVTPELALLTLASDTALTVGMTGTSPNRYRCVSIISSWSLKNMAITDGPITVGYAHSDYSVSQIKEWMESTASLDQGDKRLQEFANRLCRTVGTLQGTTGELNHGEPIKTRLNWLIGIGDLVNMFAFNESTIALTTGILVNNTGTMWISDKA